MKAAVTIQMFGTLLLSSLLVSSSPFLFSTPSAEQLATRDPNFIRLRKDSQPNCSARSVRYYCAGKSYATSCAEQLCSKCVVMTAALNPFVEYCYQMKLCMCSVSNDASCYQSLMAECY
ncbi:hypothetical protein AB6A40_007754 [Gnathostoma spinigerum]|uniref:Uncharacterized protein n=1 Tax=Gnathostoma spinigerum TaxID=75299 RepID=A0ABD6EXQ8_9BILA